MGLGRDKRVVDRVKENKCHFLRQAFEHSVFTGLVFRTAKYAHRPPLMNKKAEERDNPKTLAEGDAEATHVGIKFMPDEAIALLEERRAGMTMNRVCEYLNHFVMEFARKDKVELPFMIQHGLIPKGDFQKELSKLKRVSVGEIFVEKKLLGDAGISNRTSEVRDDLFITVKAEKSKNIKEVAQDAFDRLTGQKRGVRRIRLYGTSETGKPTVLDTDLIKMIHWLDVDLHPETGEVNTSQIFTHFGQIISSFKT